MTIRLVATTTAALLQRICPNRPEAVLAAPALEASLFGRVASTIRSWTGNSRLEVVVHVIEPGAEGVTVVEEDETVRVALPLQWVSEVWGRDLPVVGGQFALAVTEATPNTTTLWTVGTDYETSSFLTVTSS